MDINIYGRQSLLKLQNHKRVHATLLLYNMKLIFFTQDSEQAFIVM